MLGRAMKTNESIESPEHTPENIVASLILALHCQEQRHGRPAGCCYNDTRRAIRWWERRTGERWGTGPGELANIDGSNSGGSCPSQSSTATRRPEPAWIPA